MKLLLTGLIVFIIYSCEFGPANCDRKQYGMEFNSIRKKLGLPLLEKDWKFIDGFEIASNYATWRKKTLDGYAEKVMTFDKNCNPVSEENFYYIDEWQVVDPDNPEVQVYFSMTYDFKTKKYHESSYGDPSDYPTHIDSANNYTLFDYHIDYLHYYKGVPWKDLPKVDTTMFPIPVEKNKVVSK